MTKSLIWGKHQLIILMIGISRVMSACSRVDTRPAIDGMACQPFESRNITTVKLEFCSLACIKSQRCEATIYDKTSGVCMLMNDPCFSLKPKFDHVYRSFMHDCTNWVPKDGSYPAYWFSETKGGRSSVSRKDDEGNIILGKKTNRFYAISPIDKKVIIGGNYELLLVERQCSVKWVTHDTTSGHPLPKEALIGGILTATNTPLYVARLTVSNRKICGYFNPLNGKAWSDYYGAKSSTLFEIMIVNI